MVGGACRAVVFLQLHKPPRCYTRNLLNCVLVEGRLCRKLLKRLSDHKNIGTVGKLYEAITPKLKTWIEAQKMFFVATAPLAQDGHINCSPKGMDSFRVLGDNLVGYLDLTGSGAETIAHIRENGRTVIMFCAFEGAPNIVRLYGTGEVCEIGTQAFANYQKHFPEMAGARSIILVHVSRVTDSCGFGVPFYAYQGERDTLVRWAEKKGSDAIADYRVEKNTASIDGLPAFMGEG